ncbi:MAG: glycosyltransferase family 2 protein [Alphaproteobacteria bacterium]|nr:MAG: glycosyltransferase family 2 protein [Alphaproteobacteria bacterium]
MQDGTSGTENQNSHQVVIAIPMFNELSVADRVVQEVLRGVAACAFRTVIVVIDDGSNDGTQEALAILGGINVLRHERRRGVGAALRTAIEYARESDATHLLWHVGNGRVPFRSSLKVLEAVLYDGAEYAHGSRFMPGGQTSGRVSGFRRAALRIGNALIKSLCPSAPSDVTCGVRAIDLSAWERSAGSCLASTGYGAEQRLCIDMMQISSSFVEVPVSVIEQPERRGSHFRWHHTVHVLWPWLSLAARLSWRKFTKRAKSAQSPIHQCLPRSVK